MVKFNDSSAAYIRQSTGILLANSDQQTTHTTNTNHDAHLCPLLRWCLQVNRRQVVTPISVILEKMNQSTILLLADALSFQMAAFLYTIATQTEKLWQNNMTTNLPAKTATTMVVPAAAAAEMVVVGSGRRVWIWRRSRSLGRNDATSMLAIMKLLATRRRERGGGGCGSGDGGGTTMAVVPRRQRWRQQRGGGGSMAVVAATAWRQQHGGGGGSTAAAAAVAAAW